MRRTVVVVPLSTSAKAHPPITVAVRCEGRSVVAIVDQVRAVAKRTELPEELYKFVIDAPETKVRDIPGQKVERFVSATSSIVTGLAITTVGYAVGVVRSRDFERSAPPAPLVGN